MNEHLLPEDFRGAESLAQDIAYKANRADMDNDNIRISDWMAAFMTLWHRSKPGERVSAADVEAYLLEQK